MRSRYSAYVWQLKDYLLSSWHPRTRPIPATFELGADPTRWLGLKIVNHNQVDANHATVEFVARYRIAGGRAMRLHEISRFVQEDDRWWYVDGKIDESEI